MPTEKEQLEEGQGMFCDTIKTSLYKDDQHIFDQLDFYDDTIFLEPMLFGFCTKKDTILSKEQILFGYYQKKDRPLFFQVHSNQKGIIYLPNFAYLKTQLLDSIVVLTYRPESESIKLTQEGKEISFEYIPLNYLNIIPNIEVTNVIDCYSEKLVSSWPNISKEGQKKVLVGKGVEVKVFQPAIEKAFGLLKKYFPSEFEFYARSTRRIVLFTSPELRNFATRESHGTIYLNVDYNSNVTFFLEELIHQCSHIVFNAMTCDTQTFFLVNYERPVRDFTNGYDFRTLYSALHGIYTTGRIVDLLLKLVEEEAVFEEELLHELKGRIAINKKRHNIGLETVDMDKVFTAKGKSIFNLYYDQLDQNIKANPAYFDYDMRTHPVVFNYKKFKEDNPLPSMI